MSDKAIIAIVDDDYAMREALADLLRSCGYRTEQFVSAEDYLSRQLGLGVSCLLLDIRMTGMSGIELQRVLVGRGDAPPIIFVTSYFDQATRNAAMDAGARAFLEKPVDDDVLIDCLKSAMGKL